ncbi:MAG: zf-HC2 domain-containing protein [Planctomycetota bacterium]
MSLKCREIRAKLSDKLDDRLDWGEVPSVQAHLRECPDCRAFSRECEMLVSWLRDVPPVSSPNVLPGVIAGLAASRDVPRSIPRWRGRLLAVSAAVVLASIAGILIWSLQSEPEPSAQIVYEEIPPVEKILEAPQAPSAPEKVPATRADVAKSDEALSSDQTKGDAGFLAPGGDASLPASLTPSK